MATLLGGILTRLTSGAMPYLLPLLFQIGFGLSAFAAGAMVLSYALGNIAMKIVTTPILRMFGFRRVLIVNGTLGALSILACIALSPTMPIAIMISMMFVAGCCRSLQFTSLNTLMFADIADDQKSSATTVSMMLHHLSTGLGVAVAATVLNLSRSVRDAAADSLAIFDFQIAFGVVGFMAFFAILRVLSLDSNAGAEVSGHRG